MCFMATFGRFETDFTPSQIGEHFEVDMQVTFVLNGQKESGTIKKQLSNSAIVELDKTEFNDELVTRSNGVVIISYKQLEEAQ